MVSVRHLFFLRLCVLFSSAALSSFTTTALAQEQLRADEPAVSAQTDTPQVAPPKLLSFVSAVYPEAALIARAQGTVTLDIIVSDAGDVTDAGVIEGLGYGLDEAARAACLQFTFVPAVVNGTRRAARIRYAYEFRLPAVAEVAPVTDPVVSVDDPPTAPTHAAAQVALADQALPDGVAEEIVVRGLRSGASKLRSSAAVTVVDLERAQRESADMADVLARVEGVNVQRMGGLGSTARFSLAGYDDSQIRFFVDGIPLEYQGFAMGLQNVPLLFADRIDVYKGVVPVTLGADTLGGAFELISDRRTLGTRAFASYQGGAFDTHRLAAGVRHLHDGSGFFLKAEGFLDTTANDYAIDVEAGDLQGDIQNVTVRRFNDAYQAKGLNVETGFVNRSWADRVLLKAFNNDYDQELQHNPLMTLPYAEARYGGVSRGLSLRYEHGFGHGLRASFVTGYAYDRTDFLDTPECRYDWYANCVLPARSRGETRARQTDQSVWDHTGYARWNFDWEIAEGHKLIMAIAPTYFTRQGENRLQRPDSKFNELKAQRDVFKWINGLEYKTQLLEDTIENSLFGKAYLLASQSTEIVDGYMAVPRSTQKVYWGAGDGLRYSFSDWALAKISYEYSVRLPEPREIFGNTVQIYENLELQPERSHNVNLSFLITDAETRSGIYNGNLTGFFRDAQQLIVLTGYADMFRYQNAYEARVYGVEGSGSWLAPGDFLELGLNATYQEFVNRSEGGDYAAFKGDRIPNKPYLFGNATLRLFKQGLVTARDELAVTWYSRYVHRFLRNWESVSTEYDQPEIPSQLSHTAVLSYVVRGEPLEEVAFSAEGQNLTNEKVYDFYRVQKPGRAFYFKAGLTY